METVVVNSVEEYLKALEKRVDRADPLGTHKTSITGWKFVSAKKSSTSAMTEIVFERI